MQAFHIRLFAVLFLVLSAVMVSGQVTTPQLLPSDSLKTNEVSTDTSTTTVKVKNADNAIAEVSDGKDIQYFRGNVRMFHDSIFMYADSATIDDQMMTAVGNVIIIQEDTLNLFADSLIYDASIKLAKLYDQVVMDTEDKQLFTDELIYDLESKKATFIDTAILQRQTMTLSSLRGTYDVNSKRALFYDQVVIVDKDFRLTCDSLDYDIDIDRAYFLSPTYIHQEGKNIYCEEGYYDLVQKRAFFTKNAVVRDKDQTASANNILVSEADSSYVLTGNAQVIDSTSRASGEEITFNNKTGDILITGHGRYENEDNVIEGPYISFNEKSEDLLTQGRTKVTSDKGQLTADTIEFVKAIDRGVATGDVLWLDTRENRTLYAESLTYRDSIEYVRAEKRQLRPLLMQEVDGDTLYVAADTLISAKPNDTLSYLKAIDEVVIYKEDLQAICDSLYYSDVDSTFTLFGNPICWSDTTQFRGDTILIVLADDKVSQIIAKKNAFITTKQQGDYYDQIKGRYIHTYLDSNKLSRMEVKGNAECIYMIKDDEDAYVGPNKTVCSQMTFFFVDNELDSIKFYTQPESQMTPMEKATPADLKLDGFLWETDTRPLSSEGLREKQTRRIVSTPGTEEVLDDFESDVLEIIENGGQKPPPVDGESPAKKPKKIK